MVVMKKQVHNYEWQEKPSKRVRKTTRIKGIAWVGYMMMVMMCVSVALALTACYAATMQTNYEVARLQNTIQEMEKANHDLQVEISALKSPARVQAYAQRHLGMAYTDKVYYSQAQAATAIVKEPSVFSPEQEPTKVAQVVQYIQAIFDIKHAEAKLAHLN